MKKTKDISTPKIGTTCPALINENYKYHLSGDCEDFCICSINGRPCTGRVIRDPDDQSSQFFSRAKCMISQNGLNKCPLYGVSEQIFTQIIKDKMQKELEEKLKGFKK